MSAIAAVVAIPITVIGIILESSTTGTPMGETTISSSGGQVETSRAPVTATPSTPRTGQVTATSAATGVDDMIEFVLDYYRLMPDTSSGWEFIGPHLRLRTKESYDRFWSRFSGVEVLGRPTVVGDHVTAKIALYYLDGRPKLVETHVLGLIRQDGRLYIDSDAVNSG